MDASDLIRLEAAVVRGRRWIVATDVLVSAAGLASRMRAAGALDVLALAASRGTGALPDLPADRMRCMDVHAAGLMEAIRASEAALDELPPELVSAVDTFDPEGMARVVRALFSVGRPVAGRATWGARPAAWQALEDKTVIDALWAEAGLPCAPSEVVSVDRAALEEATRRVDQGHGVVWAGDSREGFNGGASATRWISSEAHVTQVYPYFQANHDRVRVMPFLDGVPCSIHGIVFPDQIVALRPNEMVVLRRPGRADFQYAGFATFWDPPEARRQEMRAFVQRVGELLRDDVGYRGAFGVDGVMTRDGFRPTELNPRIGAALYGVFGREVSIDVLNGAIVEGVPLDWRPRELEAFLLEKADRIRSSGHGVVVDHMPEAPQERRLVIEGGAAREATGDEAHDLSVAWGPGPSGGYLRLGLVAERTPVGPSVAPRVIAGISWADQAWNLGIGELQPCPDLDRS